MTFGAKWATLISVRIGNNEIMAYFYAGPSTHRTDFHYVRIIEK